jgi:hypothetical protein
MQSSLRSDSQVGKLFVGTFYGARCTLNRKRLIAQPQWCSGVMLVIIISEFPQPQEIQKTLQTTILCCEISRYISHV